MGFSAPILALCLPLILSGATYAQTERPERPDVSPESSRTTSALRLGSIKGRVVLPNGERLSDPVRVSLQTSRGEQITFYSDHLGTFELKELHPGGYTLTVEATSDRLYETTTERVDVQPGVPSVLTISLKERETTSKPKHAPGVVSAAELAEKVPPAARKEFERATKAAQAGRIEEAVSHLRKAVSIHPDYLMARNDLGVHLLGLGKLDEAALEFREAVRINPGAFNPQLNLGIVLVQQQRFAEALAFLEKAVALEASSPAARFYAGLALAGLDETSRAEGEFRAAYEQGGARFSSALFHLGQIYMERGDRAAALRAFEEYLRVTPNATNAGQVNTLIGMLRKPE